MSVTRGCACGGGVWAKVLFSLVCLLLCQVMWAGELRVLRVQADGEGSLVLSTDSRTHLDGLLGVTVRNKFREKDQRTN